MKTRKTRPVTIEQLARMIAKGFEETSKKHEVDVQFSEVDAQFAQVHQRLDRIEKLVLADHRRRIEQLEVQVKELRDLLAIK